MAGTSFSVPCFPQYVKWCLEHSWCSVNIVKEFTRGFCALSLCWLPVLSYCGRLTARSVVSSVLNMLCTPFPSPSKTWPLSAGQPRHGLLSTKHVGLLQCWKSKHNHTDCQEHIERLYGSWRAIWVIFKRFSRIMLSFNSQWACKLEIFSPDPWPASPWVSWFTQSLYLEYWGTAITVNGELSFEMNSYSHEIQNHSGSWVSY